MLLHAVGCIYACVWEVLNQLAVSFCPSFNFPLVEFRKHAAKVVTDMETSHTHTHTHKDFVSVDSNMCCLVCLLLFLKVKNNL